MASFQIYGGANYWAPFPVIRFVLEAEQLDSRTTSLISGLYEKLSAALPGMSQHHCFTGGNGNPSGNFFERLREGVSLHHVIEHVALELQNLAGQNLDHSKIHSMEGDCSAPGHRHGSDRQGIIFPYCQPEVAIAAGQLAIRLVSFFLWPERDPAFNFASEQEDLSRLAERVRFGPTTRALVAEAARRDIPVLHLDDRRVLVKLGNRSRPSRSLLQLGTGKYQQRIWAALTSKGSHIAAQIASNKELTNRLLSNAGLPVPKMILVLDEQAAVAAAREIGYPVVLKPLDSHHGAGVGVNLREDGAVRAHFPLALRATLSGIVLVESFIPGRTYRILVVAGHVAAVSEEAAAHVIGDGFRTLSQLVDLTNADPRRGLSAENLLVRIQLDEAAIAMARTQGYEPEDVPPAGQRVRLGDTAHISLGGTSIDCSDSIHPYNAAIAEQAALAVGLDVAGVDLIAPDIALSVLQTGGAICEVNAGPGLGLHTEPIEGKPRDVARPVIEMLFPPGAPSRIPIVAVTGSRGTATTSTTCSTSTTSRMIAHILKVAGRHVGLATSDGIYIDGMPIVQGDCSGAEAARMVLRNPAIDIAVLETGHQGILHWGLGYDRADIAVIMNVIAEPVGLPGIDNLEDLMRLNAVVARSTGQRGITVLNADDEWCVRIASETPGHVINFSLHTGHPVIECRQRAGARALVSSNELPEKTFCLPGGEGTRLLLAQEIAAVGEDCAPSALAAAAACLGLNIGLECIRWGLRTFFVSLGNCSNDESPS
jgi:cyanophycin synthetase